MNPIVSIILTSYNKPNSVGKAIDSVMKQTYPHWELLIMDDHSNEETVRIILKYVHDSRIHYFNSNIEEKARYKTTRYATLINEAIPKTKGKYISYLTDDNIYLPDRLKTMVHLLEQEENIDIVYSEQLVEFFDKNGEVENEKIRKAEDVLYRAAGRVDHCSVMHSRRIANAVYKKYGSYWNDDPLFWTNGDAAFWNRLNELQPFHPIKQTLDIAWKFPESFQQLYVNVPNKLPDGTLVRGLSNEIYVIDQQKRRPISQEMLEKLKYNNKQIVQIPDPFLFKYEEGIPIDRSLCFGPGTIPNQRLVRSNKSPTIYYIQNNKKYKIKSMQVFNQYKFKQTHIVVLDEEIVAEIPAANQTINELNNVNSILPDRILFKCQSQFYISFNNRIHFIQKGIVNRLKMSVADAVQINRSFLSRYEKGDPFIWIKRTLIAE